MSQERENEQPTERRIKRGALYAPELCERVIEWGRAGRTPAEWASEMGISTRTLYTWRRRYSEFEEAFDVGLTGFRACIERKALEGIDKGRQFNSAVFTQLGRVYFRQVYADNAADPEDRDGVNPETLGSMTLEEIEAKEREVIARQQALREALADAKARMRDEA